MSNRSGRLTLVIALLGLAFAAYPIWSDWWRAKSMSVVVASSSPLISSGANGSDLRLFAGNQRLESPYLVLLRISNDGGSSITANDFEGPIRIDFGPATVVKASRATSDENLVHGNLRQNDSNVFVAPTLFNAGDHLDLAVLTTGAIPFVKVDARIAGIQKVVVAISAPPHKPAAWLSILDLAAMTILSICAGVLWSRIGFRNPRSVAIPDSAAIFVAWAVFMGSMASAMKGIAPYTSNAANVGALIAVAIMAVAWMADRKLKSKSKEA